jgi:hypothetical protein
VVCTDTLLEKKGEHSLRLLSSYSLFGNVESVAAVRLPGSATDALVLSFREAKVGGNVIKWVVADGGV